ETPCPGGQQIWPSSILTSPAFFAIMPEFRRASVPVGAHFSRLQNDETQREEALSGSVRDYACSLQTTRRCAPELCSRGAKPGQATSHVFSFHNSGAKKASVFRSGETRDV